MSKERCEQLRKRFVRSHLDPIVLRMLVDEPLWGYKLMTRIKENHGVKVGPPVIYPLLDSLVEDGLLQFDEIYEGKRKRKVYSITPDGIERIECFKKILIEFSA
jgi:PadR family transcriptional regulator PadR